MILSTNGNVLHLTVSEISVVAFVSIVIIIGAVFAIILRKSTYPNDDKIKKQYPYYSENHKNYQVYLRDATAFHSLAACHQIFHFIVKIIGGMATIITVYCAFDNNNFLLVSALFAALCNILSLILNSANISQNFRKAAMVMDAAFHDCQLFSCDNENDKKEEVLSKAHAEAQKLSFDSQF